MSMSMSMLAFECDSAAQPTRGRRDCGFSLVELMVSITIGLILLSAMVSLFANNSRARDELQRSEQQTENGNYAMKVLGDDIQLAGYWAEFNIQLAGLPAPAALPDPCDTTVATLNAVLQLPMQGYYNPAAGNIPACLADVKPNTDIIVIRRVSTCVAAPVAGANCDPVLAGAPYFQASLCSNSTELGSAAGTDAFRLDTNMATLNRHLRDCATLANEHRFFTRIYFVSNNDVAGDGIPTLKRADLGAGGFAISPIAEGVDNLQFNYGLDTTGDGMPDAFTADPSSYNGCAGAACVANWQNVVAVKVNLLARNTSATPGYVDSKTYTLGLKSDGTPYTVAAPGDRFKRHVYAAQLRVYNVAGRREP
jgi:type IV pilus assembly protein PilW